MNSIFIMAAANASGGIRSDFLQLDSCILRQKSGGKTKKVQENESVPVAGKNGQSFLKDCRKNICVFSSNFAGHFFAVIYGRNFLQVDMRSRIKLLFYFK